MNKFSMTCSCGDVMNADAATKEEAVAEIQGMMTQDAIDKHMAEKHPGEPVMSVEQCHAMIEQQVKAAA